MISGRISGKTKKRSYCSNPIERQVLEELPRFFTFTTTIKCKKEEISRSDLSSELDDFDKFDEFDEFDELDEFNESRVATI